MSLPTPPTARSALSRRGFMLSSAATAGLTGLGLAVAGPAPAAAQRSLEPAGLRWVDGVPSTTTGTTWGVPWPRGQIGRGQQFTLRTSGGQQVPVQSWPLAYWPDGTLKWSGHAVAPDQALDSALTLEPGAPTMPRTPVRVRRDRADWVLDNGTVELTIATSGETLIRSVSRDGRVTAQNGRLVLHVDDQPSDSVEEVTRSRWEGTVRSVEVEQRGPVRAVLKVTGHYRLRQGDHPRAGDEFMPWTVRVELLAGADSFRIVHSFVWDGDPLRDYVRGLGLDVEVPMTDDLHNRHLRLAGSAGGIWGEPVRVLTGIRRDAGEAVSSAQVNGTATPPVSEWPDRVRDGYQALPVWNDVSLVQSSATTFTILKRTAGGYRWLENAGHGDRSPGLGYVGGVSGGLAFGIRDFWQQHPRALDVRDAGTDKARVTLWSWSPYGQAMDMRSYAEGGHDLGLAYEDNRDGFGEATGVARSTDMELWVLPQTPSRDRFTELATVLAERPQLVADPATYHRAAVFGRWSLPDRSNRARSALEDSIMRDVEFYAGQVEQRRWYGFWDFGDVMHTYDADRHEWRYDVGGYAWDNAELGSDAMLWYAFLRTGDATAFRLASRMSRHLAEVDTYHRGRFAGLGTRHNVLHWGDGAKEVRVAEAWTKRFHYYVTADELIGDYLRVSLQADRTLLTQDPLRGYLEPTDKAPTRLRIGPDWYALVGNWLAEWERTGDDRWKSLIETGMRDIANLPAGLFTGEQGGLVGFDPETGHIVDLGNGGDYRGINLAMAFCGEQILFETIELVDVPEFREKLVEFARYVLAPAAEKIDHFGFNFNTGAFPTIYSRVTAWAGEQLDEPEIRERGWRLFLDDPAGQPWPEPTTVEGSGVLRPVEEIPAGDFATNDAAQRTLAIISLLAIAPEEAP